jgi:hypothetical protein
MSYDLAVFGTRSLSPGEVADVIRDAQGLDVAEHDPGDSGLVAVRGKQRLYCFTVDGPLQMEPEDVPPEITAVLLGAMHIYTIMVEGSAAAAGPHAARFARRLARAVEGAVHDQQTGEVWARGASRKAVRPARVTLIDIVQIHWYALHRDMPADIAARYLALSRRYLPEALPRRFGSFEPFQHKLETGGDQAFIQAQKAETSLLFFTSQPPCFGVPLAAARQRLTAGWSVPADSAWTAPRCVIAAGAARSSGSLSALRSSPGVSSPRPRWCVTSTGPGVAWDTGPLPNGPRSLRRGAGGKGFPLPCVVELVFTDIRRLGCAAPARRQRGVHRERPVPWLGRRSPRS